VDGLEARSDAVVSQDFIENDKTSKSLVADDSNSDDGLSPPRVEASRAPSNSREDPQQLRATIESSAHSLPDAEEANGGGRIG
jgi:hypothetical protein